MQRPALPSVPKWLTALLVLAVFVAGVAVLMLWLVGTFKPKVAAESLQAASRPIGQGAVFTVIARTIPVEETAVGSIQPVHRAEVASRIMGRALEVNVLAGQEVHKGDILVRLEDSDLKARRDQAESGVAQAQAALDQARTEESRVRAAFDKQAAAALELDRTANALKAAEAGLSRAKQSLTEAQTVLDYATIRSPMDGKVVDKRVNPGDTVSPGQTVVALLDPTQMQMVASVRESLSKRLSVGGTVMVRVDAADHTCSGTVSEIVPQSDSVSRTFEVKVTGPCPDGVYAGMFGRLSIPVGEEVVLLIPRAAVKSVGQVDVVDVAAGGVRQRRAVRLGRIFDTDAEVLSGLTAGEHVVVDNATPTGGR